jgi:hypothetical protein
MTLIVETGAGLVDSDAFVSLVDFKNRCDLLGWAYNTTDDDENRRAIRRATVHLSSAFNWQGRATKSRSHANPQALAWPRIGVVDKDGDPVPDNVLPTEVANATVILAVKELVTPGAFSAEWTASDVLVSESYGEVEFQYDVSQTAPGQAVLILTDVLNEIGQFLKVGSIHGSVPVQGWGARA